LLGGLRAQELEMPVDRGHPPHRLERIEVAFQARSGPWQRARPFGVGGFAPLLAVLTTAGARSTGC
jgi:hypothetical protein